MHKDWIYDELRNIEREVVDGERKLAEQEALILDLRRKKEDTTKSEAELATMRTIQRRLNQDRQRLLAMLQP